MVARILKVLFFGVFVKPLVLIGIGLNVLSRKNLPDDGPAVIVSNHNSHLDTLVLMALFPLTRIHRVRPVAAADYFLRNKWLAWFSLNVIGIIPIDRVGAGQKKEDVFASSQQALQRGDILILFPEGTRGRSEERQPFKKGIYHLLKSCPQTAVIPVAMHGLGKALPKGEALLVPFNCDVVLGDPLLVQGNATEFVSHLDSTCRKLLDLCLTKNHLD